MGLFANFLSQRKTSRSNSERDKALRTTRDREAQETKATDNRVERDRKFQAEQIESNRLENIRRDEEINRQIQNESDRRSER